MKDTSQAQFANMMSPFITVTFFFLKVLAPYGVNRHDYVIDIIVYWSSPFLEPYHKIFLFDHVECVSGVSVIEL